MATPYTSLQASEPPGRPAVRGDWIRLLSRVQLDTYKIHLLEGSLSLTASSSLRPDLLSCNSSTQLTAALQPHGSRHGATAWLETNTLAVQGTWHYRGREKPWHSAVARDTTIEGHVCQLSHLWCCFKLQAFLCQGMDTQVNASHMDSVASDYSYL